MDKCKGDDRKFYADREKVLLLSLVEKFKHILENKKTDATNWQKKNEAWKNITELYNANDVHARTDKQLKKLWDNLKQRTRKNDSEVKKQIIQTGGGPPPPENTDPINEMVRAIVPTIGYVVDCPWDSTAIKINENKREAAAVNLESKKAKMEEPLVIEINQSTNSESTKFLSSPLEMSNSIECSNKMGSKQEVIDTPSFSNTTTNKFNKDIKSYPSNKSTINRSLFSPPNNPNIRIRGMIEEEAALRVESIKKSIEQQEELHVAQMETAKAETEAAKAKMKAAEAERNYWLKKTNSL